MEEIYRSLCETKLNSLQHINRYSGLRLIKSESVSDHVSHMVAIALTIVPKFNKVLVGSEDGELDLKDIIYRISVHDLDEAVTCDFPRPIKYYDEEIRSSIERVTNEILNRSVSTEIFSDIVSAKDKTSREGLLVGIIDLIQAGQFMKIEIQLGNTFLRSEIINAINALTALWDYVGSDICTFGLSVKTIYQDLIHSCIYDLQKIREDGD
jgi:Predicted hydrolases of HD superfamily